MKKSVLFAFAVSVVFAAPLPAQQTGGFPAVFKTLVQEGVFEVVIKKPEEKNIVYDKELDWSEVPYAIRTDKYYSIGTAFAISATEAVTAFHVADLSQGSDVFGEYYIRDSAGKIYEFDTVVCASNEKDFIVFTAAGKTFSSWFDLRPEFTAGDQVYSIGNALGEGIVVRSGLVLGTVPEEEDGRWNLLKSSADGNPGNSGGPLVTPDGAAVALVAALRDNILYSLPAAEILSVKKDSMHVRKKLTYSHFILANKRTEIFTTDLPLPAFYKDVRNAICGAYKAYYPGAMTRLFEDAPAYLEGPNNRYILNQVAGSDFPAFGFVDKNDGQWKISSLNTRNYSLYDDGSMAAVDVSDFLLVKIRRPKTMSLEKLNTDPKTAMDLLLSGAAVERTLGGQDKYRILSLGEPEEKTTFRDKQGRVWIKTWWLRMYEDMIMLVYILPTPSGPALLMTRQNSGKRHVFEWDMEAACDRIAAAYQGDMGEWKSFLEMKDLAPDVLKNVVFNWDENKKAVSLRMPNMALETGTGTFNWNSQSALFLAPAYYLKEGVIEYGIRSTILRRDIKGSNYFVLVKNIKPDERLGAKVMENWSDLSGEKYPFDGISRVSAKDNSGAMGAILSAKNPSPDLRYSLYLTMENPGTEDALAERFAELRAGITITN